MYGLGRVVTDANGVRWRITSEQRATPDGKSRWRGTAVVNGVTRTEEIGPKTIEATEAAPLHEVGDEVTVGGQPGIVLCRHGDGLEAVPVDTNDVVYTVRILRDVQPFGSAPDDVRQVHAWTIDP